jgi:hypothetical protein
MEPIRDAVRRSRESLQSLLDEWVEISMDLPDTPQRRRLNASFVKLEEAAAALGWD